MNGVQESETDKNIVSKSVNGVSTTYSYNNFNQQISVTSDGKTAQYAYNTQGIRTVKAVDGSVTKFYLDGGNVVGEITGTQTVSYLRGLNLIHNGSSYYLFNAHADVVNLTNASGTVTKTYSYDAFGVEKNPSETDTNRFRYCGEYWDAETETYYLRARYYDPALGRFTQQDTHWNTANMIYGDNPQKINEREDRLGLKSYSFAPQIAAVMQSGNLYVYCGNNPVYLVDMNGQFAMATALLSVLIGGALLLTGCSTNSKDDIISLEDMPGYYDDIDMCISNAISEITDIGRNATAFGHWVECGRFIVQDINTGYYAALPIFSNKSESHINISYKDGRVDIVNQRVLGFIHTHPHNRNNNVWTSTEFYQMSDEMFYMVVAYEGVYRTSSTVYYATKSSGQHIWNNQTYSEIMGK